MDLDDVFLHFWPRFAALPNPKSVAEGSVTPAESEDLAQWFIRKWELPLWCESMWQDELTPELSASRQEMFGALLLILAAEKCRDRSNEDSVWPTTTEILKHNSSAFSSLFVGRHPTNACKKAMIAGARRLGLRNLIDRYGSQEYFETIKLQFGFTYRGACRRLADWLDGSGTPVAVTILNGSERDYGDLQSSSFTKLWTALHRFRHGHITEEYATAMLTASPWVRSEWIIELLTSARRRIQRTFLSAAIAADREAVDREASESICEPVLHWNEFASSPCLVLRLNEEMITEILGDSETAVFSIDGKIVDRWTVQDGKVWRGRRDLPCQPPGSKPNLRPRFLNISGRDQPLEQFDLFEIGLGEPLLLFDLSNGSVVDLARRIDPAREYAILHDSDLSVTNTTSVRFRDRLACHLSRPWRTDVEVTSGGVPYWKPRINEKGTSPELRVRLESLPGETCQIGTASLIRVTGVPEAATSVELVTRTSSHSVVRHDGYWQTAGPVVLTIGMAVDSEPLRIRMMGPGYARTVTPRLSVNLRGIARVDTDAEVPQWTLLDSRRPLDRADGTGRARVFVDRSLSYLYEGPRLICKTSSRTLPLSYTSGWGAPLLIQAEGHPDIVLIDSVEDHGLGHFMPPLFRRPTGGQVGWQAPMTLRDQHQIVVWTDIVGEPSIVAAGAIRSDSDGLVWKFPVAESVAAMAVTYGGVRIASYWSIRHIIDALRHHASSELFGLLRWLKAPVLNSALRAPMQAAVWKAPTEFLTSWLGGQHLAYGLRHRDGDPDLHVIIREFLWSYLEKSESRMDAIVRLCDSSARGGGRTEAESFESALLRLGDICPSLAYNLAKLKLRGDKYRKYVRCVVAMLLSDCAAADSSQLQKRLSDLRYDCAVLIGSSPEALDTLVHEFALNLNGNILRTSAADRGLRRLGETSRGRRFLTAGLLLDLLGGSRL